MPDMLALNFANAQKLKLNKLSLAGTLEPHKQPGHTSV